MTVAELLDKKYDSAPIIIGINKKGHQSKLIYIEYIDKYEEEIVDWFAYSVGLNENGTPIISMVIKIKD